MSDYLDNTRVPTRRIRDHENPFERLDHEGFIKRYRLSKDSAMDLLCLIREDLTFPGLKSHPIPPHLRLLAALRFYATGHFQITDGDLLHMAKSTICRVIHQVSRAIAKRRSHFMKFPSSREDLAAEKLAFYRVKGFPSVIGLVDGTHVRISSPGGENAEVYRNRKGQFSINVQAVCNSNMEFTHIVARWPGSTHDSRIFESSTLSSIMSSTDGILLGDSGYPCLEHLLTPVLNPSSDPEERYNKAHIGTRIKVERSFGVWKGRFRCLYIPLRTKLSNTLTIIVATACLHNFCIWRREQDITAYEDESDDDTTASTEAAVNSCLSGRVRRQQIITDFFS